MRLRAYSVYDEKTLNFGAPFYAPTDGGATRSFSDLANDTNTQVGTHPGDFKLYHIGHFDTEKGQLQPLDPINHVVDAVALVRIAPALPFSPPSLPEGELQPNGRAR